MAVNLAHSLDLCEREGWLDFLGRATQRATFTPPRCQKALFTITYSPKNSDSSAIHLTYKEG